MSQTLMRNIPFIEAKHVGRKQRPKAIAIRLSNTTSDRGAAMGIANAWHRPNSPSESCHYVIDESLVFNCVPVDRVAYSMPFDSRGIISINVCAQPTPFVEFWQDQDYSAVLYNTARLVSQLSLSYKIPICDIDLMDVRGFFSRGGIMINVKGAWPKEDFLDLVQAYKKQGGA